MRRPAGSGRDRGCPPDVPPAGVALASRAPGRAGRTADRPVLTEDSEPGTAGQAESLGVAAGVRLAQACAAACSTATWTSGESTGCAEFVVCRVVPAQFQPMARTIPTATGIRADASLAPISLRKNRRALGPPGSRSPLRTDRQRTSPVDAAERCLPARLERLGHVRRGCPGARCQGTWPSLGLGPVSVRAGGPALASACPGTRRRSGRHCRWPTVAAETIGVNPIKPIGIIKLDKSRIIRKYPRGQARRRVGWRRAHRRRRSPAWARADRTAQVAALCRGSLELV